MKPPPDHRWLPNGNCSCDAKSLHTKIEDLTKALARTERELAKVKGLFKFVTGGFYEDEEKRVIRIINGGLRDTIKHHGPIDPNLIGSASKRIYGEIRSKLGGNEKPTA